MFKVNLYKGDKGSKHSAGAEQYQKLKMKDLQSNFGSNRRGISSDIVQSLIPHHLLTRQPLETHIKCLFPLSIRLSESEILSEQVYKDDTPVTICDRLYQSYPDKLSKLPKDARKELQNYIEYEINTYLKNLEATIKKEEAAHEQKKRDQEQLQREKRLKAASKLGDPESLLRTSKRNITFAEKPIVAKLSIIVAPNKKGDIIVREGQEDEKNLTTLVRNFVVCYGLKKDMFLIIKESLQNLIANNKGQK